ncbi:MAG: peptidase MA family metallohydrolase [Anaerolineae bacterium]|nr:peptidase MA family metallohydrolase [Anaerolineae bacterium]
MRPVFLILILSLLLVPLTLADPEVVSAATAANVTNNQPTLNFPDSITFQATIESSVKIVSVVLEYGTNELTCGTVVAKAFPQFSPGTTVEPEWTWEMKQSGSLPPGTTIWWRWRYKDQTGLDQVSEQKTLTWLGTKHSWQITTSGLINLHWYSGDQAFAQDLLNAASTGLMRLQADAGLEPTEPIHLYIYANTDDMKDAILYEPSWTGGLAFPEHNIVIIGISQRNLEWGRATITHELSHVLIGHLTFSCLGDVPTWLNEGLAVYSEGELDPASKSQLNEAISNDNLLTVRSLSGGFSEIPDKASLSYSQSYSIINFLIDTFGQEKMNTLLITLRDGTTIDDSLISVYGFNVDGLQDNWRAAIGAPLQPDSAQPTSQPSPTTVPTYVPFVGVPLVITPTPLVIPTSSVTDSTGQPSGPPLSLTLMLVAICCILVILFVILGLGIYLTTQKNKGDRNE